MSSHTDSFVASGSSPSGPVCMHGVALESSCSHCALDYDHEIYGTPIGKALAYAKGIVRRADFEELTQDVHLEIWAAARRYGDRMNEQLAYQIAKNQAAAFLRRKIKSELIAVSDADGNPVLDEFGLARGLDGTKLRQQSEDPNATPGDRRNAKKLIQRYTQRHPRFESLTKKPGTETSDEELTEPRLAAHEGSRFPERAGSNLLQTFRDLGGFAALRKLISPWRGDKRQVAEAMLEPDFTVRSVPGLDKSKVSRLRRDVLQNFRRLITN